MAQRKAKKIISSERHSVLFLLLTCSFSLYCLINLESRPGSQAPSLKPPQLLQAETSGSSLPVPYTSFNMLNVRAFLPFHHLCFQMVFLSVWAQDHPSLGISGVEPSPAALSASKLRRPPIFSPLPRNPEISLSTPYSPLPGVLMDLSA